MQGGSVVKVSGVPPRGTGETKYFFFPLLQGIILGFVLRNWFSDLNISQFGSAPKSLQVRNEGLTEVLCGI